MIRHHVTYQASFDLRSSVWWRRNNVPRNAAVHELVANSIFRSGAPTVRYIQYSQINVRERRRQGGKEGGRQGGKEGESGRKEWEGVGQRSGREWERGVGGREGRECEKGRGRKEKRGEGRVGRESRWRKGREKWRGMNKRRLRWRGNRHSTQVSHHNSANSYVGKYRIKIWDNLTWTRKTTKDCTGKIKSTDLTAAVDEILTFDMAQWRGNTGYSFVFRVFELHPGMCSALL